MRNSLLLGLCLLSPAVPASPPAWRIDPVHTRVTIAVDHAGFSRSLATLSISGGWLWWDAVDPAASRVEVDMAPSRLDFGDARWNQAVHGKSLLDVAAHPTARFHSTQVAPLADGSLRIDGELTLRGATAPVSLIARHNGQRRHPLPPYRLTTGFSAVGQLSRSAFGATAWADLVGDTVELRIELEASRQRHPGTAIGQDPQRTATRMPPRNDSKQPSSPDQQDTTP